MSTKREAPTDVLSFAVARVRTSEVKQLTGGLAALIVATIDKPMFATTDCNTMLRDRERSSFTRVGREWCEKKGMLSL